MASRMDQHSNDMSLDPSFLDFQDVFGNSEAFPSAEAEELALDFGGGGQKEDSEDPYISHIELPATGHSGALSEGLTTTDGRHMSISGPSTGAEQQPVTNQPLPSLPRRRSHYFRGLDSHSRPIAIPNYRENDREPLSLWRGHLAGSDVSPISAFNQSRDHDPARQSLGDSRQSIESISRPASITSLNSDNSSRSSKSVHSAGSSNPRRNSRLSNRRGISGKAGRQKRADKDRRMFCCTFCCDSFKSKYDWTRHEKALHLSLERWICTPHGGAIVSPSTARSHCAYCNMLDPTPEHLDTHNHGLCQSSSKPPVFSRKDHLVQHLRLIHELETLPLIDEWKVEAPPMVSRCGFCDARMNTWHERVEHLARHFRQEKTMDDWAGEHGFEPSIASQVTNALPPYLIGSESRSVVPFSATSSGTRDHFTQMQHQSYSESRISEKGGQGQESSGNDQASISQGQIPEYGSTTFVELLTRGLGNFARQKIEEGIIPTDEMFQNESRRLIYGTEDAWDQTIADNSEWLADFRGKHLEGKDGDRSSR